MANESVKKIKMATDTNLFIIVVNRRNYMYILKVINVALHKVCRTKQKSLDCMKACSITL